MKIYGIESLDENGYVHYFSGFGVSHSHTGKVAIWWQDNIEKAERIDDYDEAKRICSEIKDPYANIIVLNEVPDLSW